MKKIKYFYNPATLRFEKLEISNWSIVLRVFGWICTALVFAGAIVFLAYTYMDSPKERYLKNQLDGMELEFSLLDNRLDTMAIILDEIEHRDDNIYRTIFEADPISRNDRLAGIGGSERFKRMDRLDNSALLKNTASKLELMRRKMVVQSKSFDEISKLVQLKEEILMATPAIQPVSNKDLDRISSGFGYRIHPIYKVLRLHEGIDFTAPRGTEIYATANGVVEFASPSASGYGNELVINHGFGYKSRYAHLNGFNVRKGQSVKRGELIGYIGNTGLSTAPHLHYEIEKDGIKLDPINFFYNDLTPEEYLKLIQIANQPNQSYD
ncbi:MAG: M23 family metallopeptidase [Bacteroidetes bacterium]|nr:M23 family metallopeptidase [Bacteroidota bacterium]MBP7398732.1 M23 family metallopeptidase [Chitinophagales bacterium]MBK7109066.1 M23 family metallopeptidase [Bacteroidota bacterium]MBK8488613.1 M23 family metallopeptidase [Bacteroidota bacterium]MBK8681626.1 M23 family metallopeptidase [Bacteroidota bacterium]